MNRLTTTGTFSNVASGWHNVQVSKSGYQTYSTSIEVKPGATSTVYATLTPNKQVGSISVSSNPVGASLYVDTIYQGYTNQIVGNLAAGTHTVLLKKSGYKDFSQSMTVNADQTVYMTATLTPVLNPTTGDLEVSSSPSGASIYLNSAYQGETRSSGPFYITALSPGTYTVVLKKSGYLDYTTATQIVAGSTAKVSAVLAPASGTPTTAVQISIPIQAGLMSISTMHTKASHRYPLIMFKLMRQRRIPLTSNWKDINPIRPGHNKSRAECSNQCCSYQTAAPTPTQSPLSPIPILGALCIVGLLSVMLMKKR